ncbi:MAG: DNA polymerase III subunit gamma/tau [Magnetospiraceae bacterium]
MSETATPTAEYRVLARKYRPDSFEALIGQQAMVRTLTNAIDQGRLAHAFIMTGVRGIGKTTTARLIARALNCIGPDGTGGPTITPCGVCDPCTSIAADRHVDVLELDAASRTGVDDIREIIDGVRYRPTAARFKIYIIDEVHMLSRNAFNALLKTLEEPPAHVKFIFATTEIRKVPVTVLSRCQRFDLRRVEQAELAAHFKKVADLEGATIEDDALTLIARAADGSVRDGLSLLDQAIAHGGGTANADQVRSMLGLADRAQTFDLFDQVMEGKAPEALAMVAEQYRSGADPEEILRDLLNLTHWLTRLKLAPAAGQSAEVPETERARGQKIAERLSLAALTRTWQMLLKGLDETRMAPSPLQALEMILVRLIHAADLPTPAEAIASLHKGGAQPTPAARPAMPAAPAVDGPPPIGHSHPPATTESGPGAPTAQATAPAYDPDPADSPPPPGVLLRRFEDVVDLAEEQREARLRAQLINNVHLVHFELGRIEFHPGDHAEPSLAGDLKRFLEAHTDQRWVVTISGAPGAATLHQQREETVAQAKAEAAKHPLVAAVLDAIPGTVVETVRQLEQLADTPLDEPPEGDDG